MALVLIGDLRLTPEAEKFAQSPQNVHLIKFDVTNWKDFHSLVAIAEEKYGHVPGVYVVGAGILESV